MRPLLPLVLALAAAGAEPAATIRVDAARVLHTRTRSPVGINVNYLMDADARRPAGSRPLAAALREARVAWLRYPGGDKSDNLLWTVSAEGRPMTPADPVPSPLRPRLADPAHWPGASALARADGTLAHPVLDFDAFIALCHEVGAEPVVVVAYDEAREISGRDTAPTMAELIASAAAWVRYANVQRGWRVRDWSIGNEAWFKKTLTAEAYVGHVRAFAAAMRAQDPTIRILAHGNDRAWFAAVGACDAADIVDVHDYPMWEYRRGYDEFRARGIGMGKIAEAASHAGRRPLQVTETNAIDWGPSLGAGGWENDNDLGHALAVVEMLGGYVAHPRVEAFQLWNTRWIDNPVPLPPTATDLVDARRSAWRREGAVEPLDGSGPEAIALGGAGGSAKAMVSQVFAVPGTGGGTLSLRASASAAEPWSGAGIDYLDAAGAKIGGASLALRTGPPRMHRLAFAAPAGTDRCQLWIYAGAGVRVELHEVLVDDGTRGSVNDALLPDNAWTPVGQALRLWGEAVGDRVLAIEVEGPVRAWAVRDGEAGEVRVIALNREPSPVAVRLEVAGFAPRWPGSRTALGGTPPDGVRAAPSAPAPVAGEGGATTLTLDPWSATVLRLQPR